MSIVTQILDQVCEASQLYERLIGHLLVDNNGCWLYKTPAKNGYGQFGIGRGKAYRAHRVSYEIHKGKIPEGHHIDHTCSVKNCCNPDHLEAVTPKENTRRAWERGEAKIHCKEIRLKAGRKGNAAAVAKKLAMTHCKKGHPYDEANTIWLKKGGRDCRVCRRVNGLTWYYRNKK